ncbi:MAG: CvpA family protein [Candidatus Omnitrophota bacterium]
MSFIIDIIVLGILAFFVLNGYSKGIVRILIGPLSLAIGVGAGYYYFHQTSDIFKSFLLICLGPIVLNIFLTLLVNWWNRSVDGGMPPTLLSRLLGGFFNFGWSIAVVFILFTCIATLPPMIGNIFGIQDTVLASKSYQCLNQLTQGRVGFADQMKNVATITQHPEQLEAVRQLPQFQEFSQNEKVKEVLADPEIVQQIEKKDLTKLLSNPKIAQLMQDKDVVKKIMDLNAAILTQTPSLTETQTSQPSSQPENP